MSIPHELLFQHPARATWGWIDLLSSIPTVDTLRWGRAGRMMRIIRVLRGLKSARALTHFVVGRRAESAFLASILVALLLLVSARIAIVEFEVPGLLDSQAIDVPNASQLEPDHSLVEDSGRTQACGLTAATRLSSVVSFVWATRERHPQGSRLRVDESLRRFDGHRSCAPCRCPRGLGAAPQ